MFTTRRQLLGLGLGLAIAAAAAPQARAEGVVNVYTYRQPALINPLLEAFTAKTGIEVRAVFADNGLVERLAQEGRNSPADVLLTADAGRLVEAADRGLTQPVNDPAILDKVPANLRDKDNQWFGLTMRARVIYASRERAPISAITYEELADPKNKGKVCIRSGSHPYNLSLFAAMTEHLGDKKTEEWLKGIVANLARDPKGGDTDQIKAVGAGECQIAVSNTYYIARLLRSNNPADKALMDKVAVVFPNQASWGTHLNIAGGAVARHAKNTAAAVKFLEYLASPDAQAYFADGNNEWPTARGVKVNNPALQALSGSPNGNFKAETLPLSTVGAHAVKVQQMLDRVGFK
jgi:iron(III) transport system substrate-binding protein